MTPHLNASHNPKVNQLLPRLKFFSIEIGDHEVIQRRQNEEVVSGFVENGDWASILTSTNRGGSFRQSEG